MLQKKIAKLEKLRLVMGRQYKALQVAGKDTDAIDGHLTAVINHLHNLRKQSNKKTMEVNNG